MKKTLGLLFTMELVGVAAFAADGTAAKPGNATFTSYEDAQRRVTALLPLIGLLSQVRVQAMAKKVNDAQPRATFSVSARCARRRRPGPRRMPQACHPGSP